MSWSNRKYIVLTSGEVEDMSSSDFGKTMFANAGEMPCNRDSSKYVVKYEGSKPSFLSGKTALTHTQILSELDEDEWQGEDPE